MPEQLRDMEEKQRLLKERILLIGQNFVDDRAKTFSEIQDMKKTLIQLKEEVRRTSELVKRIMEQISGMARKEELMILQRQFELFRKA